MIPHSSAPPILNNGVWTTSTETRLYPTLPRMEATYAPPALGGTLPFFADILENYIPRTSGLAAVLHLNAMPGHVSEYQTDTKLPTASLQREVKMKVGRATLNNGQTPWTSGRCIPPHGRTAT